MAKKVAWVARATERRTAWRHGGNSKSVFSMKENGESVAWAEHQGAWA